MFDDAKIRDPLLGQMSAGTQSAEAAPEDRDLDFLNHCLTNDRLGIAVNILEVQHIRQPLELLQRLSLEALIALFDKPLTGLIGIKVHTDRRTGDGEPNGHDRSPLLRDGLEDRVRSSDPKKPTLGTRRRG